MGNEISPLVEKVANVLQPWLDHTMVVALSGGKDSSVLLSIMCQLRDMGLVKSLRALHIHHGLCKEADNWALHCESICARQEVTHQVVPVSVQKTNKLSPEEAARVARYQAFEKTLKNKWCLLQAHHGHDVVETLLYRLCRGTGVFGLEAIPEYRALGQGMLVRPLLRCMQDEISEYAHIYNVRFVEDYSNFNQEFDRNYLRYSVVPLLEKRWPKTVEHCLALVQDVADMNQELSQLISQRLQEVIVYERFWSTEKKPLIDISRLLRLSRVMMRNVLREWFALQNVKIPNRKDLHKLLSDLILARADAMPVMKWCSYEIRRFRGFLLLMSTENRVAIPKVIKWDWLENPTLKLPDGGELAVELHCQSSKQCGRKRNAVRFLLPKKAVNVRFRGNIATNRKFAVVNREGKKTLKRWLQSYDVPPWVRHKIPILFYEDQMMGVPDLWCCPEFYSEQGVRIIRHLNNGL